MSIKELVEADKHVPRVLTFKDSIIMLGKLILDDDLVAGQHLSLMDRISLKPLSKPSRGLGCKHVQCFDFDVYLMINKTKLTSEYSCPFCNQLCNPSKVYVDLIFMCLLELFPKEAKFNLTDKGYLEIVTGTSIIPKDVICIDVSSSDDDDGDAELFKQPKRPLNTSAANNRSIGIKDEINRGSSCMGTDRVFLQDLSQMVQYLNSMGSKHQLSDKLTSIEDLTRVSLDDILHLMNKETAWGIDSIPGLSTEMQLDLKNSRPFVCATHQALRHSLQLVRGVGTQKADNIIMHFSNILQSKLNGFQSFIIHKSAFTNIIATTTSIGASAPLITSAKVKDYIQGKRSAVASATKGSADAIVRNGRTAITSESTDISSHSQLKTPHDSNSHSRTDDSIKSMEGSAVSTVAMNSGGVPDVVRLNSKKRRKKRPLSEVSLMDNRSDTDRNSDCQNSSEHLMSQPSIAYDTATQFEPTHAELINRRRRHRPSAICEGIADVCNKPNFSKKPSSLPTNSENARDAMVTNAHSHNVSSGKSKRNHGFNTSTTVPMDVVGDNSSSEVASNASVDEVPVSPKASKSKKSKKQRPPLDDHTQRNDDKVIAIDYHPPAININDHRPMKIVENRFSDCGGQIMTSPKKSAVAIAPQPTGSSVVDVADRPNRAVISNDALRPPPPPVRTSGSMSAINKISSNPTTTTTSATVASIESDTYPTIEIDRHSRRSESYSRSPPNSSSASTHPPKGRQGDCSYSINTAYTHNTYIVNNYHSGPINGESDNPPVVPPVMGQALRNNRFSADAGHASNINNAHSEGNVSYNKSWQNSSTSQTITSRDQSIDNSNHHPHQLFHANKAFVSNASPRSSSRSHHRQLNDSCIDSQSNLEAEHQPTTVFSRGNGSVSINRDVEPRFRPVPTAARSGGGVMGSSTNLVPHRDAYINSSVVVEHPFLPAGSYPNHSIISDKCNNYGSISNKNNNFYRRQFRFSNDSIRLSLDHGTNTTAISNIDNSTFQRSNGAAHDYRRSRGNASKGSNQHQSSALVTNRSPSFKGSKGSVEPFVKDFNTNLAN